MNKIALYLSLLSLSSVPLIASSARFTSSATTSTSAASTSAQWFSYLFGKPAAQPTTANTKVSNNIVAPSASYLKDLKSNKGKYSAVKAFQAEIKGCKAAAVPNHPGKGYLRVVTYNVHMFKYPQSKMSNWNDVCANIKALDADVLILQEVKNRSGKGKASKYGNTEAAFSKLGYYSYFASYRAPHRGRHGKKTVPFGNMILVRNSIPVVSCAGQQPDDKHCTVCNHSKIYNLDHKRSAVQVELDLRSLHYDKNLIIFGTHLHNKNKHGEQEAEARVLCDLANKPDTHGEKNVIVAADFNATAGSSTMKVFDKNFMKSSFDYAGINDGQYFTHMYADVIDRIMLKNGFSYKGRPYHNTWSLPIVGCYILYDAASDHLPVVTDFKLR